MKTIFRAGVALSGLVAAGAMACETPSMVAVPDGSEATMDEMVTAQQQVKDYVAAMEEYLACINEELEAAGEDAPDEYKSLMITRHNSAVGEMESVAAAFNEQVQAYKAANPE
ncbi:MAG: hypothetical protein JXB36_04040 [Gammaproteobacteria bacterium]|nr:hypothetical protein [Gammaproteobacteria bacterium]